MPLLRRRRCSARGFCCSSNSRAAALPPEGVSLHEDNRYPLTRILFAPFAPPFRSQGQTEAEKIMTRGVKKFLLNFLTPPTTWVLTAESRHFATAFTRIQTRSRAKSTKIAVKCRIPDRHFTGAVKNIEFFYSPAGVSTFGIQSRSIAYTRSWAMIGTVFGVYSAVIEARSIVPSEMRLFIAKATSVLTASAVSLSAPASTCTAFPPSSKSA